MQPGPCRQRARAETSEDQPGGHHGQHPRGTDFVGREVGGEGEDEQHGVLDDRCLGEAQQPASDPPDDHADAQADGHGEEELPVTSATVKAVPTEATATW